MGMVSLLFLLVGVVLAFAVCARGQQQSEGFISIDCGIDEDSNYTDDSTKIYYTSDSKFIDTGINRAISLIYVTSSLPKQYQNLRSFPDGSRNCYTLSPVVKSNRYLVRASFMYGNYDGEDSPPQFDIYLGVNRWDTVVPPNASVFMWNEMITVAAMDYISVCLVNTDNGTPFMSTLELRPLNNSSYQAADESQSLVLYTRLDPGSTSGRKIRYPDDIHDRMWAPWVFDAWVPINTSSTINVDNGYNPASAVMGNAATPSKASENFSFFFPTSKINPKSQYHAYLHFAELEKLQSNQSREFNFAIDGDFKYGPFSPRYLTINSIYTTSPLTGLDQHEISLYKTQNSTLPPILNAVEIYTILQLSATPTDVQDEDAIMKIKALYQVTRDWMGDPCVPANYSWDGLNCSYSGSNSPYIISLDLSSSGLTGQIAPSLANLTSIQFLDLSNNNLTGPVPDFLTKLPSLKFLNLSYNRLTGEVPTELLERSKNGSLSLSVNNNPDLVGSDVIVNNDANLCQANSCKKVRKVVVPVVASVISALLVLTIVAFILWKVSRQRRQSAAETVVEVREKFRSTSQRILTSISQRFGSLRMENRRFTYDDIITITSNFEMEIGRGGFGAVYHGYMNDGTQVAVKILSQSSSQGSREFRTEAELLMKIHHRNLASFVGYCDEDRNKAIIYEYMAKGNLREYLSGAAGNANGLNWVARIQIAVDAALGLEYLHYGCKPPIIHRDVKATNILLSERLEAKIADFGLSKSYPQEGLTHVSTAVMGTPGYLDPEYYISTKLNEKSDVYSFGIVLLELITGQPAIISDPQRNERMHIVQWVGPMIVRGEIANVVDPRLGEEYDPNSAWKAIEIAMACTPDTSIQRPNMSNVVSELKDCLAIEKARQRTGRSRREETDRSSNSVEMAPNHMRSVTGPLPR